MYFGLSPVAVRLDSGPAPAPNNVPGYHTTDGDTLLHWKLDGNGTDDGSIGADVTITNAPFAPYPASITSKGIRQTLAGSTNSATLSGSPAKTAGSITIAGWFWFEDSTPGANTALIGVRGGGSSGNPDAFNFTWELGITSAGDIRGFHQYDNKLFSGATATGPLAIQTWYHLAVSRSADGLTWKVYIDGIEQATNTAAPGTEWDGGTSQNIARILHNSVGDEALAYAASCIVKDITLDTASALALYNDGLT